MSFIDIILSHIFFLTDKIKGILAHCRAYHNCHTVIMRILLRKYPIDAILQNGNHIKLSNRLAANIVKIIATKGQEIIEFDKKNDIVTISSPPYVVDGDVKVTFYGALNNGDVFGIFVNKTYDYLPAKGRTVIDVGANIADSSIYFALCGAHAVVGIEPYFHNYKIGKKNIELNNLSHKITMLLAGCSGNSGYCIATSHKNFIGTQFRLTKSQVDAEEQGISIPLMTLEEIINKNNLIHNKDILLKMDCEGCEYETILDASSDILQQFSHIQIEYHQGYKNLKAKLEKCGFNVRNTRTVAVPFRNKPWQYIGYIYAERNGTDMK